MVACGTDRDQILSVLFRIVERTYGSQLRRDLVRTERIYAAAALPLADLFQLEAQSLSGYSRIMIQIHRFVLQSTAGEIAVFHSVYLLVCQAGIPALLLKQPSAKYFTEGMSALPYKRLLDVYLSDNVFQLISACLKLLYFFVCQVHRNLALYTVRSYK